MDEILKPLLESEVLSAEVKQQIAEAFQAKLVAEQTRIETEVSTRLTEEFVKAREELVDALDAMLEEQVTKEFNELHHDIEQFRDLEVELAEKLIEEKEQLAIRFGQDMDELVDKLDMFLEQRVDAEFEELRDEIAEVKRLNVGKKMLEAFGAEYKKLHREDTSKVERELAEAQDKLADAQKRIVSMEKSRLEESRQAKMDELLKPLSGTTREQMRLILASVKTEKLEESYSVYLGRILKEAGTQAAPVIVEDKQATRAARIITGNEAQQEQTEQVNESVSGLTRLRQLAGLV
jgi:hypothetical protein